MPEPEVPGDDDGPPTLLLDGGLRLRQPRTGHRAGTDAVLLAAACAVEPGSVFVDMGAGVGTVGLALALREPTATGHLIERSGALAALAAENAVLNGVAGRVRIRALDVFDRTARILDGPKATLVATNPPFYLADGHRASPDTGKADAHVLGPMPEPGKGHATWLLAALSFLAPRGALVMIHRPDALPALLAVCEGRLGGVTVRPIHAHAEAPATRILLGGRAGSRGPFLLLPPLVLHRRDGRFTEEAERVHRGGLMPLLQPKKKPATRAGFSRTT